MKISLVIVKCILLISLAYSLFLFGHKLFLEDAPTKTESIAMAVQGVRAKDYPGFVTGVVSGMASPFSNVAGFCLGAADVSTSNFPGNGVGVTVIYNLIAFSMYGEPQFHFGFMYNIGFILGLLLVFPAILALGVQTGFRDDGEASSSEEAN